MRQKTRRAQRDSAAASQGSQTPVSYPTSSSNTTTSPSLLRPSNAVRQAPATAAVLPSISAFMLSNAPAPTLMLGTPPLWATGGQASSHPAPPPPTRSPAPFPSVLQFSRIGPPPQIDVVIDPQLRAAHSRSTAFASRPLTRSPSAAGPSEHPFGRPDGASSSSSSYTAETAASSRWPPEPAAAHFVPAPNVKPAPAPVEPFPASLRLPSFSDLVHSSESRAPSLTGVHSPPPDYAGSRTSSYAWSSASSQAGSGTSDYSRGSLPPAGPSYGQPPLGPQYAPTFASPPSPRSASPSAHPLPSMHALSVQPTPSHLMQPSHRAPGVHPSSFDLPARNVSVAGWLDAGKAAAHRSASMGDVEVPKYGSREARRPPGHLEVVGTGGKAGLGRWSISNCAGRI